MSNEKKENNPSDMISSFLSYLKFCQKEYQECMQEVWKYDKKPQDYLHELEFCNSSKERSRLATKIHQDRKQRRELKDRAQRVEKLAKFYSDKKNKSFIDSLKALVEEQRKMEEYLDNERHYNKRGGDDG